MKPLTISSLLLLAGISTLAGATDVSSTSVPITAAITADGVSASLEAVYNGDAADAAQHMLQMSSMPPSESARHRQEKAHLMKRMDRKTGKWGTTHPRYRLLEALYGFTRYRERNLAEVNRWRALYGNMNKSQKKTLERAVDYKKKLNDVEELIYTNEVVCKAIVSNAMAFYSIGQRELDEHIAEATKANRVADRISTSQTLKHIVRDWADEGSKERNDAFPCLLSTLKTLASQLPGDGPRLRVLLPGSGLGRLGTEIAKLSLQPNSSSPFEVTANEWSMYMNIGYRFLASRGASALSPPSSAPSQFTIHPFIDSLSHQASTPNLVRPISAPNAAPHPSVLLVEGDFTTAFAGSAAEWDIIVTHFFIDTARNLMSYFDTIHRLLRPGGRWVNFGPLLYGTGPFVQLSLDEIVAVVEEMGFVFEEVGEECGEVAGEGGKVRWTEAEYGFDSKALTRNAYKAQVWVVRKV